MLANSRGPSCLASLSFWGSPCHAPLLWPPITLTTPCTAPCHALSRCHSEAHLANPPAMAPYHICHTLHHTLSRPAPPPSHCCHCPAIQVELPNTLRGVVGNVSADQFKAAVPALAKQVWGRLRLQACCEWHSDWGDETGAGGESSQAGGESRTGGRGKQQAAKQVGEGKGRGEGGGFGPSWCE